MNLLHFKNIILLAANLHIYALNGLYVTLFLSLNKLDNTIWSLLLGAYGLTKSWWYFQFNLLFLSSFHTLYLWLTGSACNSRGTRKPRSQMMLIEQTECNCLCVLVISWNKLFLNAEVRQGLIGRNTIGVKFCSRLFAWCHAKSTSSLSKRKFSLKAIGSLLRPSFNSCECLGNVNLKLSISAS